LLIQVEAYSDVRPVGVGWYIGDEINYLQGKYNPQNKKIDLSKVTIRQPAKLGTDNDTLSKLRAWFGYSELITLLMKDSSFKTLYSNGLVFTPEIKNESVNEQTKRLDNSKIIVITNGKYSDKINAQHNVYDKDLESSLYIYDTVRRINVIIEVVMYQDGKFIKSPCCNPKLPCTEFRDTGTGKLEPTNNETDNKKTENTQIKSESNINRPKEETSIPNQINK
jgi:hypothetical protein